MTNQASFYDGGQLFLNGHHLNTQNQCLLGSSEKASEIRESLDYLFWETDVFGTKQVCARKFTSRQHGIYECHVHWSMSYSIALEKGVLWSIWMKHSYFFKKTMHPLFEKPRIRFQSNHANWLQCNSIELAIFQSSHFSPSAYFLKYTVLVQVSPPLSGQFYDPVL